MIEYKKIKVSGKDKYIDELLKLSKAWADENSCPALNVIFPEYQIDKLENADYLRAMIGA